MTAPAIERITTQSPQLRVPLSLEPTLTACGEWFQDALHLTLEQGWYEPEPHVTMYRESGGCDMTIAEIRLLRDHLNTLLNMAAVAS